MNHIDDLKQAIRESHGAFATHLSSVPVRSLLRDGRTWDGFVEVFMVSKHPKARTAYAWMHLSQTSCKPVTVLHLPPIDSPETAVRAAYGERIPDKSN
jgi:hypothetical protein